jgi:hypothetical protein
MILLNGQLHHDYIFHIFRHQQKRGRFTSGPKWVNFYTYEKVYSTVEWEY